MFIVPAQTQHQSLSVVRDLWSSAAASGMNLLLLFLSSLSFLCGLEAGKEEDGKEGQRQISIASSMDMVPTGSCVKVGKTQFH